MKQFIHPGKEGQLSFQNNSLVFLAFSITQRLKSSSSGERTVSADGPTYILNKEWPGCPHHLSDFLSILCTLSILSILYTQKPSRRVDSNQCQIFSQIRSADIHSGPVGLRMSEVEVAPPPLLRPFLVLPSLVQTDQTPFLTFYQTQVLALACLVIHHSMGLLCLSQCLICRPQHSGFFIFDFHWSHGAEIENIKMHSFFFPLFFRCDSHSLPPV